MKNKIFVVLIASVFLFIISCNDHTSPTLPAEETPTASVQTPSLSSGTQTPKQTVTPSPETPTPQSTTCIPGDIEYEIITNPPTLLNYSYFNGPVTCVAKTYEECVSLFGENFAKTIDFNKKIVIGSFNYGTDLCYSTSITNVTTDCNKITVHVFNRIPCPTDVCAQALSISRDVIIINKTTMLIDFDISYNKCCSPIVNYKDISSDLVYNCMGRGVYVINSESEFNALFSNSNCLVKKPNIDFSKKTLISVFMGSYPDSCYSTEISFFKDCFYFYMTINENYGGCPRPTCLTVITYPQKHILIDKINNLIPLYLYFIKDSDNDNFDDREEYLAGTDICDPASHP